MIFYLSEFYSFIYLFIIYLFIYLFTYYLFILLIYQIFIGNIFAKNLSRSISENILYIMIYKYDSFEFKLYSL